MHSSRSSRSSSKRIWMSRRAERNTRREKSAPGRGEDVTAARGAGEPFPRGCDAAAVKTQTTSITQAHRMTNIAHFTSRRRGAKQGRS